MQPCPSCGEAASGRFCAHCGVAISATCHECENPIPPGGRFCNQCGASAAPAARAEGAPARSSALPWAITTGVALVALAAVLLVPRLQGEGAAPPPIRSGSISAAAAGQAPLAGGAPLGDPGAVDLASLTPRDAADRLFNRVMRNVSTGDSAQARAFLPMAIAAYERVDSLDADGHYHLAVLQLVNGDARAAKAEADTILARDSNHLFGLFTAAQAEEALGNRAAAQGYARRFLARYDAENARKLPEYTEHAQAMEGMKQAAERWANAGA